MLKMSTSVDLEGDFIFWILRIYGLIRTVPDIPNQITNIGTHMLHVLTTATLTY